MISVATAQEIVRDARREFGTEVLHMMRSCSRVVASPVFADRDFPPFHRVTMDGIAVNSKAFEAGRREFTVEAVQAAGSPRLGLAHPDACIEVMTGAILPDGVDGVIPYENCILRAGIAYVTADTFRTGQHVHQQGSDAHSGDLLITEGSRITPALIGIMASVGLEEVVVRRLPRIAVCATGDELVEIGARPLAHQIRRSNSYMLAAALLEEGIVADLFHLGDNKVRMMEELKGILPHYDAILFSGAVSKGKYDYLPEVLVALGMRLGFHRVAQKPGKPMLFGAFDGGPLVFGLPGNPVSTLVCLKLYFLPWLYASWGVAAPVLVGQLAEEVHFIPPLTYHLPVTVSREGGVILATPHAGANSGDMLSLGAADAVISLPAEGSQFSKGELFPLTMLRIG